MIPRTRLIWKERFLIFKCKNYSVSFQNFKNRLLEGELNQTWRRHMRLLSNRKLPDLDRCEGGMGGDNNSCNRQMRYPISCLSGRRSVKVRLINPPESNDVWTDDEIEDLMQSFVAMACTFGVKIYCIWRGKKYFE